MCKRRLGGATNTLAIFVTSQIEILVVYLLLMFELIDINNFYEYLRYWDHAEIMYIKKDCSKYWFLLHIQKPSKLWWDGWKIDDYLFYFIRYSIVELILILIRTLCTYLKLHLGNHQRSSNMIYRNVNHYIFYFKQYFGIAYFFFLNPCNLNKSGYVLGVLILPILQPNFDSLIHITFFNVDTIFLSFAFALRKNCSFWRGKKERDYIGDIDRQTQLKSWIHNNS